MNRRFAVVSVLALVAIVAAVVFFLSSERKMKQVEAKYADNPVMLYQTVGIKGCGYDHRHKGKRSGAVRLEGDDLNRAVAFLERKWKGITVVLYINAPEASERDRGQPALLPLKRQEGTHCVLGVAGSYGTPLFLEFEKKYQDQI